jgi:hypothetical protein
MATLFENDQVNMDMLIEKEGLVLRTPSHT